MNEIQKTGGMSGSAKAVLAVVLVLVIGAGAFLLGSSSLFQGRIFRSTVTTSQNKTADNGGVREVPEIVKDDIGSDENLSIIFPELNLITLNVEAEPHDTFGGSVINGSVLWNKGFVTMVFKPIDFGPDSMEDLYRISDVIVYEAGTGNNLKKFNLSPSSNYILDDGTALFELPLNGISTIPVEIGLASNYWKIKTDVYRMDYDGKYHFFEAMTGSFDNGAM